MNVIYQDNAKQQRDGYVLLQQATKRLEETVAKPTHDEIIREHTKELGILNERVNTLRRN